MEFRVTEMNGEIIFTNDDFRTVYYKPDKLDPRLALRRRTETEDQPCLPERGGQQTTRRASSGGFCEIWARAPRLLACRRFF